MKWIITLFLLTSMSRVWSQNEIEVLYDSYQKNSTEGLVYFFENWNKAVPTVSDSELSTINDTLRQAYHAFTEFYRPTHIKSIGGSEWGSDIYKDANYLIVQNSVYVYFTEKVFYNYKDSDDYIVDYVNKNIADSLKQRYLKRYNGRLSDMVMENFGPEIKSHLTDSIMNFRPSINCNNKKPLYLTSHYDSILNNFLGNKYFQLGAANMMSPATAKDESKKRQTFLEHEIKIFYGHWGGYWQLFSYPVAYSITFDKQMHYAKVNFRMVYEGGEAILENQSGRWVLISSRRTWIE